MCGAASQSFSRQRAASADGARRGAGGAVRAARLWWRPAGGAVQRGRVQLSGLVVQFAGFVPSSLR
jgi:hypothetical protein